MKTTTQTIACVAVPPGEYLTAGDRYTVERRYGGSLQADVHFRNQRTGGGTYMREYAVRDAIAAGHLCIVEE